MKPSWNITQLCLAGDTDDWEKIKVWAETVPHELRSKSMQTPSGIVGHINFVINNCSSKPGLRFDIIIYIGIGKR